MAVRSELEMRPLRADARRNREAILAVARAAFTEDGPHVPLDEIAKRAGVGPATLFRHFAGRDELVTAVAVERFDTEVEPVIAESLVGDDAWDGLVAVVGALLRLNTSGPGWRETVAVAREAGLMGASRRDQLYGPLGELLIRAQRAGQVRSDAAVDDLVPIVHMLRSLATVEGELPGDAWIRYFSLFLRRDATATP